MRRREFMMLLGGTAAWPLAVRAQEPGKIYRIGFLANDPTIPTQAAGQAFLDGLRESGFIEGQNILIDWRFAQGRSDLADDYAAALVRLQMDAIVASSDLNVVATKRATTAVAIVMLNTSDPVGQGIVASLAHPGGNITGVIQDDSPEISAKRLQLFKEAVPQISRVAVLTSPDEPFADAEWKTLQLAAQTLGMKLQAVTVRQVSEFEDAFDRMTREGDDALFVASNALTFTHRRLIMDLAAKSRLPAISNFRETTEVGGLMSYESVRTDRYRRAAIYVGKILKGTKPADLPVEQPTRYELVINLKTARTLGLTIPPGVLAIADEVVE
jgi:putative tryptophan/tyrosine transport system substrate-binding protein